jgi:GNAT superfamily N-acetyltransferase
LPVDLTVRDARREDVALIFGWVVELADYEHGRDQVAASTELFEAALFGPTPSAEALIAELRSDPGSAWEPAGFALFYKTFSTWEGRPGIWLEDLYVPPVHRRYGVGGALLSHLAKITVARGFTRLEWAALDWNEPALSFYSKIGAARLDEWVLHRLDGAALDQVGRGLGPVG